MRLFAVEKQIFLICLNIGANYHRFVYFEDTSLRMKFTLTSKYLTALSTVLIVSSV